LMSGGCLLPFESPDLISVGRFRLPKLGCLTVQEAIALDDLLTSQGDLIEGSALEQAIAFRLSLQPAIACLLLISRDSAEWTLERVSADLSAEEVEELCDFLLGERRRWADPQKLQQPASSDPVQPTDWGEIFWVLQLAYPNEPRFSADEFGRCPLVWVEGAIAAFEQQELRRSHRAAVPVSLLGCYTLAAQGVKSLEPGHFNPFERMLNQYAAVEEIDPAIARTLVSELDAGRVPDWAIPMVPIGKFRLAAKG
jgi:hypothetical protein